MGRRWGGGLGAKRWNWDWLRESDHRWGLGGRTRGRIVGDALKRTILRWILGAAGDPSVLAVIAAHLFVFQ